MIRTLTLSAALLTATAFGALATDGHLDATRSAEIKTKLTEQGYDVRKIEMEDGMIEVYALKDGQRLELYLDEQLNVVRTKADD